MSEDDFSPEVPEKLVEPGSPVERAEVEAQPVCTEVLDESEARRAVVAAHALEPEPASEAAQAEPRTTMREFVKIKSRGKRFSRVYEQGEQLGVKVRPARDKDLDRLIEIDLAAYIDTYEQQHSSPENNAGMLRERLETIQRHRGSQWMLVAEVGGTIEGFMTGQPTNKTHERFVSWDDSTDYGTLEATYDSKGRQLYVVNLTVTQRGSKHGAGSMLIGNMYGSLLKAGMGYAFFSSRMPGFRSWLADQTGENLAELDRARVEALLGPDRVQTLAEEYWQLHRERDSKRKDWQLRMYEGDGFKLLRLIPQAYPDPHSLDYGVVAVANNPLPKWLRHQPVNWLAGSLLKLVARSPKVANNLF